MSTTIEWTQRPGTKGEVWNPTTGCDRISAGCDHCYAAPMAKRLKAMGQPKYQTDGDPRTSGPGFGVAVHEDTLTVPLGWRKPRTVFVNSMSDLFHARVPRWFIAQVWHTMACTPQHTYQILTKRPERMARIVGDDFGGGQNLLSELTAEQSAMRLYEKPWPLPNVWLGTSVESADYVGRIDALRETSAAVRFLSLEPLLGPMPSLNLDGIGWVIIGGESGPNARLMDLGWLGEIIDQCRAADVPVFVKQLGTVWARDTSWGGYLVAGADRHGRDPKYWPASVPKVRQYPAVAP